MARKILLADDSVTAQNMGRKILSDAGYEVITVNNGSAALKKIAEQKPDLIVLDVYMPGYSGLEVCQRIKDTRETSRIPILLTVGKLEPFKPEEARKAKADAYIVKPFEASELLVALTKLEDKIVPQAEPYKPGRFAKAIAAVERFNNAPEESFGDKDSGWKNRIKFPSIGSRPPEPEPEEVPGKKGLHDQEKPVEPSRAFERPIPEGLPKDITPEEIEAITAAAAQFSEHASEHAAPETEAHDQNSSERSSSEPVTAAISSQQHRSEATPESAHDAGTEDHEPQREESPPVTFAGSGDQSEPTSQAAPSAQETYVPAEITSSHESQSVAAEVEVSQDRAVDDKKEETREAAISAEMPAEIAASAPAASIPAESIPAEPIPAEADVDVAAALQNLSPASGNGQAQPVAAAGEAPGPRWVAEPVSLDSHEATLTLEKEMHKAFAAFAAADNARATFASIASEASPPSLIDRPWITSAPSAQEQPAAPAQVSSYAHPSDSEDAVSQNTAETLTAPAEVEAVAPPSSAGPSELTASVQGLEAAESQARAESSSPDNPATHNEIETPPKDSHETAEKAAAWENWQNIRDTVVGSTADLGDVAAAALANSSQNDPSAKPEAMVAAAGVGTNSSSTSEGDSTAIASIVDSVLAELKPKLMEEIARKMKKDSKQE